MDNLQAAKAIVLTANQAIDRSPGHLINEKVTEYFSDEYLWRGMYPLNEITGIEQVFERFWSPLKFAFGPLQRRPDLFLAGFNQLDNEDSIWVAEMGHWMGNWTQSWLGLEPTGKLAFLRYAEFHRVENDKIVETACYCDLLNLLALVGRYPLGKTTGEMVLSPGPRTHDGLLFHENRPEEGKKTVDLISAMIIDLRANQVGSPGEHMKRFWTEDMCWFGPGGIGASAFFEGYRLGHSGPFEQGLEYVDHTEHVTRIGEGNYGGFFGYPSLRLRSTGGFMGLPESKSPADMRIVDLYRRDGDKLAENWIFIDLPYFLQMQGVDLFSEKFSVADT